MDTILINGAVHTMDGRSAEAIAIQGDRLALVGSNAQVSALKTPDTRVIDLEGRCVLPGFADSHMHLMLTGLGFERLDLRGVSSQGEIVRRGRAYLDAHPMKPGEWLVGYGFDHNLFSPSSLPDGKTAEAISEEVPVLLDRVCGHVGAANGAALRLAGYDAQTAVPGGELDRDPAGRLTGVLREAALDRIKTFLPLPDQEQVERIVRDTGRRFAQVGLTSIHSDDLEPAGTDLDTLTAAFTALEGRGELSVRVFEECEEPRPDKLRAFLRRGFKTGDGTDWLRICNVKLITDGSLGARTAYLRSDYTDDPGNRGIPVYTQEELNELVALCQEKGLQVAFHAIGDGAAEQCVNAVEQAMARNPRPLGHRIVHCQIGDPALYHRMGALGMGADIQPPFTASDRPLAEPRLGAERTRTSYAWKTLLNCGVTLGGGSDSPVESYDPLWGIYCAVTRRDGQGGNAWMPEECLTVAEAVALYTTGPAKLAMAEKDLGTLTAGKLADLVVLDRDIFAVAPEEIRKLKVVLTMAGGKVTYQT